MDDSAKIGSLIRYERGELLRLRCSGNGSHEQRLQICEALGNVAFELDEISTEKHFGWKKPKRREEAAYQYQDEDNDEVEYFSDSSDGEGLRKPALYVEGEPDFNSGPPQDGFEFLRRVRWEESRCERVKVAKICASKLSSEQTAYMPNIPPIPLCDPELLPSKVWEAEFLSDFSNLRLKLTSATPSAQTSKLPHFRDRDAWRIYCFGSENRIADTETRSPDKGNELDPVQHSDCEQQESSGRQPYLSTLLVMDEVSRATLLCHHISWLQDLENLPEERAVWLYALAAVVDEPLDLDTSAAMRELLRKCASIRALRSFRDERELQMLNIIITIAGKYFGQADQ